MENDDRFVYTAEDFLGWAIQSGWQPSELPAGVVFTFQAPVTMALSDQPERFRPNTELTVSNARTFMTADAGPPVLISCLNPGGASMVTQLEHLRLLAGDRLRSAIIVGTAGAIAGPHVIGDTVVVRSALRADGISDRYLAPSGSVDAAPDLVERLRHGLDEPPAVTAWTVAVPYRSSRADLVAARDAGAEVVEMEAASLFAAGQALGVSTAAAVVVSDVHRVDHPPSVDWSDTTGPLLASVDAAISAARSIA